VRDLGDEFADPGAFVTAPAIEDVVAVGPIRVCHLVDLCPEPGRLGATVVQPDGSPAVVQPFTPDLPVRTPADGCGLSPQGVLIDGDQMFVCQHCQVRRRQLSEVGADEKRRPQQTPHAEVGPGLGLGQWPPDVDGFVL